MWQVGAGGEGVPLPWSVIACFPSGPIRWGGATHAVCVPPAGSALADGRYFVRGIREACYMAISLASSYCDTASLWGNPQVGGLCLL